MDLSTIITPDTTFINLEGASKKRVLENAAGLIAGQQTQLSATAIFDSLIARERLGSTGMGEGVAIPHCRNQDCVSEPIGALFRLQQAVDFDALDNQPVDLLFILLVPQDATEEHLQLLGQIAERFANSSLRNQLRNASDKDMLLQKFIG